MKLFLSSLLLFISLVCRSQSYSFGDNNVIVSLKVCYIGNDSAQLDCQIENRQKNPVWILENERLLFNARQYKDSSLYIVVGGDDYGTGVFPLKLKKLNKNTKSKVYSIAIKKYLSSAYIHVDWGYISDLGKANKQKVSAENIEIWSDEYLQRMNYSFFEIDNHNK